MISTDGNAGAQMAEQNHPINDLDQPKFLPPQTCAIALTK
jgi:hypothetical protein